MGVHHGGPNSGHDGGRYLPCHRRTALLVLIMSLAGVPIGTVTAVYLSGYASSKSCPARLVRFAVNTPARVPSIVIGLFGLGFFVQFVWGGIDRIAGNGLELNWAKPNLLWASMTMALLTLPVVIVSVEEAIHTVPQDLRAASLALGRRNGKPSGE